MTEPVVDLEALSKLAEQARESLGPNQWSRATGCGCCMESWAGELIDALSPDVVLFLVSRVQEAERKSARLREAGRSVVDSAPAGVVAHDHGIGVPMPAEACHGCRLRDALGTLEEVLQ